jgi:hypothetical protein
MPILQVRDMPPALLGKLRLAAEREHRSLSRQAVVALEGALQGPVSPKDRRRALLGCVAPPGGAAKGPDPVALVREDRTR